ncbi:MAG: hypothetical protein J6Y20_00760 [Lachnospiraceae bacterium]|nr:hypothetical protein [Lachnospiraceae bacterium]
MGSRGAKRLIACLLGVCFIAAVGLTVAAVSGKTGGTRKSNAVWVIKEATTSYYTGTSKYRYTYDDNGREILRVIETTRDGEEPVTNTVETDYFPGGCGIYRYDNDYGYTREVFFVTDPVIYSGKDPVKDYEVDASGKLTKVECEEVEYSINTWFFDSEGRPAKLWHNASEEGRRYVEEFQYDDSGRIIRITDTHAGVTTVTDVVYEGDKRTVRRNNSNGLVSSETEYDGQRRIRETYYDEEGNVFRESKYYFPNGEFPLPGKTAGASSRLETETYLACESLWLSETQTWEMKVDLAPDGQPLREISSNTPNSEYEYDENGRLSLLKYVGGHLSFQYDENGNLVRCWKKGEQYDIQYVWEELK